MPFTNIISKQTNKKKGAHQKVSITEFIELLLATCTLIRPVSMPLRMCTQSLLNTQPCDFCNVPPAYKFTDVQRLPHLQLSAGSD